MVEARRRSVKTPGPLLSRMTPAKTGGRKSALARADTPRVRKSSMAPTAKKRLASVAEKDMPYGPGERKSPRLENKRKSRVTLTAAPGATGIPMPRKSVRKSTVTAPRKSGPLRKSTAAPKSTRKSVATKKSVGGRKSVAKKSVGGRKSAVKKSVGGRKSKPKRDSLLSARDSTASMKSAVSIEPPKRKRNSTLNRKMTARMKKDLEPEAEWDVFEDEEEKPLPRLSFYERKRKTREQELALKKAQEEAHAAVEMPKKKAVKKAAPKKAKKAAPKKAKGKKK